MKIVHFMIFMKDEFKNCYIKFVKVVTRQNIKLYEEIFIMNTTSLEQFVTLNSTDLAAVEGGWGGWGDALAGLLGGFAPSPTLDQLNGKWPIRKPPKSCSPYGTGGTPNFCNGI